MSLDHYDVVLNDGEWHNVHLMIGATNMSLTVDKITVSTTVTRPIRTGEKYFEFLTMIMIKEEIFS